MSTLPGQSSVGNGEDVLLVDLRYDHPDAVALRHAFREEQIGRYGFADPAEYEGPHGAFLVVYYHNSARGCGGFRWFDRTAGVAELKKLYAAPQVRGHGLGGLLLIELERMALERGARRIIVESGVKNLAALALFKSFGYQPIPSYVDSRDPQINRAFAKTLTSEPIPATSGFGRASA
jgi:GNAT superfamily N-acetyltransferase